MNNIIICTLQSYKITAIIPTIQINFPIFKNN